jgi:HlyD family secretion protein
MPSKGKFTHMTRRRLTLLAILSLAALAAAFLLRGGPDEREVDIGEVSRIERLASFVTASGEIVPHRFANVGANVMGRLVELRVREGDRVEAGQVLARIDPVQAASAVDAAAEARLALEADARGAADQVRTAQADLEAAQARATDAELSLARARDLRNAGLIAQSELDAAVAAADTTVAQVTAATSAVRRAEQSREAAERRVAQARADEVRARDSLDKTAVTAPVSGVVTRLEVEEGEMVVIGVQNQPGTTLMTVSDLSVVIAEVKVAEADVLRLSLDQPATVTLEALPSRSFTGRVVEIGASALPQTGAQAAAREFRVKVQLEGDTAALRPGLTCDAEILVAERTRPLIVPLQAVVERTTTNGARTGVFTVRDGVASFTPVEMGIIGGLDVEIEGLEEGTPIIVGPFQALREIQDGTRVRAPRR